MPKREEDAFPCERCAHSPYWHRLDDSQNISPTDINAKFRCLGVDYLGCDCEDGCPNFVPPPGYKEWIESHV